MKNIKIKSEQPDIMVKHNGVSYGFSTDYVEIPEDFAKKLLQNPNFKRKKSKDGEK